MRWLKTATNVLFYTLVLLLLVSAAVSALLREPFLFTVIRSQSMYPTLERGDLVLITRVNSASQVSCGDIVVFRAQSGSLAAKGWIMHRVAGGNPETGFITKGDANQYTDQEQDGASPVKPDWIAAKAVTLGKHPLHLPLVGYVTLWAEQFQQTPYAFPIMAGVLAVTIALSELSNSKRKKQSKLSKNLELPILYWLTGATISVLMAAVMLTSSQHLVLPYEVSTDSQGIMMGSSVGVLKQGEIIEKQLAELNNRSFLPVIAAISCSDHQISFSSSWLKLQPGQNRKLTFHVMANNPGVYRSSIWIGMYFPFLPAWLIARLAARSFWLALTLVAMVPGLPVVLYPLLDRRSRRRINKALRYGLRCLRRRLPV